MEITFFRPYRLYVAYFRISSIVSTYSSFIPTFASIYGGSDIGNGRTHDKTLSTIVPV
jgi:hypothetical protein